MPTTDNTDARTAIRWMAAACLLLILLAASASMWHSRRQAHAERVHDMTCHLFAPGSTVAELEHLTAELHPGLVQTSAYAAEGC